MVKLFGRESDVYHLFDQFKDFFWSLGYFGWQIATIYALYVTFSNDVNYSILFLILFLLTGWLNHKVLKNYIHNLRPADPVRFLAKETFKKRSNGMPSGHAQQTAFSLTIAYLFTHKLLYVSILLFALTALERYVYRNHSLPQLLAGGLLGCVLGFGSFHLMRFLEKRMVKGEHKVQDKVEAQWNAFATKHQSVASIF
jgi:hypothetical protein